MISNHKTSYRVAIVFISFTPFSFLFLSLYFIFLVFLTSCSNFIIFWVFIELMILIFMGVAYTLFSNNFSSLMIYFLVQTISSFRILVFYLFPRPFLFTLFVFLKLSIFPFHFWFLNICYRFPNFILYLSSSFHKIPVFLIFLIFNPPFHFWLSSVSICLTVFLSGLLILSSLDTRAVIVSSSIGNNSWFLLSSMVDFFIFFLFVIFYSLFLFFLFFHFYNLTKFSPSSLERSNFSFFWSVLFIRGLPPFPLFYIKLFLLLTIVANFHFVFIFTFIFSACLIVVGYLNSLFKFFTHNFSSPRLFLV